VCYHGVRLWKKPSVFERKTPTKVDLTAKITYESRLDKGSSEASENLSSRAKEARFAFRIALRSRRIPIAHERRYEIGE